MYEENVYLLDLCILSYHLHAQTLIWPFDPYYEQMIVKKIGNKEVTGKESRERRKQFMAQVHAATDESAQLQEELHGPGSCQGKSTSGWEPNDLLEPVIANYKQIYPWRPAFTRPTREDEEWIVYNTPHAITDPINEVNMVRYSAKAGPNHKNPKVLADVIYHTRPPQNRPNMPAATDLLYCFEGGTGAIGDDTMPTHPAWSMMGFVLARTVTDVELKISTQNPQPLGYDIYIVFRGSRSGKLRPKEAGYKQKGNPDWVTDLEMLKPLVPDKEISAQGSLCRGFRTSIKSMLPTVVKAMTEIHMAKGGTPRNIFVTGHSLGAALACHFTSAMLCGTKYGPDGAGTDMPGSLRLWPWRAAQLVTFSSPVVGDAEFQKYFDAKILSRRVWLDGDPITQEQKHSLVGVPWRISVRDKESLKDKGVVVLLSSHQPYKVRRNLIRERLAEGYDMSGVPAGTGQDHRDEPWKIFKYSMGTLSHLESLQRRQDDATQKLWPFRNLFPNMVEHLLLYLKIFQDSKLNFSFAEKQKLKDLIYNVEKFKTDGNPKPGTLERYWTSAADIQADIKFVDFIGLCLFLAALSEGFCDDASASTIKLGEYPALLNERI